MTPLKRTIDARSYSEKQPKALSLDLPKMQVSSERREDFPNGVHSPQESKLNISSEGLYAGQQYASPGRCTSISGKASQFRAETVKAPDNFYLEPAQHEIQMSASQTRREGFNGSKTYTNGGLKPKTVNYGEKLVKACPILDMGKSTHENALASGKSLFRSNGSENQAFSTVNGCETSLRSNPLPNKPRRNGETLVSEMTVSPSCPCPSSEERHLPAHDSSKCWRKPLIDQIFITDVTSNFVTVTVKECLTDQGFFRQR